MSEDGFLSRWARRKQEARAEAAKAEAAPPPPTAQSAEAAPPDPDAPPSVSEREAEKLSDAEILERLALPDPATLAEGSQVRAFLRKGVPMRLQRAALRRLWAVTPEQACFDGLIDYADDFTDAAVAVRELATTYEVGKGLRAHVEELARQEEAERAAREGPAEECAEPGAAGDTAGDTATEPGAVAAGETPEPLPAAPAAAAAVRAHGRPHVRPPDSRRSAALQEENDRSGQDVSDQSPNPDEIALGQDAADDVSQMRNGAATSPQKPRRMVFRFDES